MDDRTTLGRSSLSVPRLGVGAMTWGEARGIARLHPAQIAYGGAHGYEEEKRAVEASLEAGVDLFDTAAMYSGGASERRLGELAAGRDVLIASKFPAGFRFRVEDFPQELEASLSRLGRSSIDLYQHHFPRRGVSIRELMEHLADAVEAGKVTAVWGQQLLSRPDASSPRRTRGTWDPPCIQSGRVLASPPSARDQRCSRRLPGARGHPHRIHPLGRRSADRQVLHQEPTGRVLPTGATPLPPQRTGGDPTGGRTARRDRPNAIPRPRVRWPSAG